MEIVLVLALFFGGLSLTSVLQNREPPKKQLKIYNCPLCGKKFIKISDSDICRDCSKDVWRNSRRNGV